MRSMAGLPKDGHILSFGFIHILPGGKCMPRKIVDFSAISKIIRDEPFYLHFWESTPQEALAFLKNPRAELEKMGIKLPAKCRIETTIENHDYLSEHTGGVAKANGTIIFCISGGEDVDKYYKYLVYLYSERTEGQKTDTKTPLQ